MKLSLWDHGKSESWKGNCLVTWSIRVFSHHDAGKDWRQEEKGMTEDEMAGWHQLTQWTWVWVNSRSWRWTGRPSMLQSRGSQRAGHDWATELNWTEPFPPPVDLLNLEIEQGWVSCIAGKFFTIWATREALKLITEKRWYFGYIFKYSIYILYDNNYDD